MKTTSKTAGGNRQSTPERSYELAKASAREQSEADAKARDVKTARLKAQRMAQEIEEQSSSKASVTSGTFKKTPRRKKQAVTMVALSPDAKRRYEELAQGRDERQRGYEGHLPPTPRR